MRSRGGSCPAWLKQNLSTSTTMGVGLMGGFASFGASYSTNGFTFGAGVSANSNSMGIGVNFDYKGFGAGYSLTHYGDSYIEGRDMSQVVGGVSLSGFGAQFQIQNDFLGDGGDRNRTNAWEFSYGHFVIGSNIYTNDPSGEGSRKRNDPDMNGKYSKGGSWEYGAVYSAPLWVGTKFGNSIDRIGYSHPKVQNAQQNFVHRRGNINGTFWNRIHAGAPYYNSYDCFKSGFYNYSSFYNPYSLFER